MVNILTSFLALGALASAAAVGDVNNKNFHLKTKYISGNKTLNNYYLTGYHSGAGFNDAVLLPTKEDAVAGYLVRTNATAANGHNWYNVQFPFEGATQQLVMNYDINTYAGWQPSFINIGGIEPNDYNPNGGFWFNKTGLQYNGNPSFPNSDIFDGWLVCPWWRGEPQLFFKIDVLDQFTSIPESCASVDLIPEYI